jgi:hypothetical protein
VRRLPSLSSSRVSSCLPGHSHRIRPRICGASWQRLGWPFNSLLPTDIGPQRMRNRDRAVSRRCVGRDDLLEDVCRPLATSQKRFEAEPSTDAKRTVRFLCGSPAFAHDQVRRLSRRSSVTAKVNSLAASNHPVSFGRQVNSLATAAHPRTRYDSRARNLVKRRDRTRDSETGLRCADPRHAHSGGPQRPAPFACARRRSRSPARTERLPLELAP